MERKTNPKSREHLSDDLMAELETLLGETIALQAELEGKVSSLISFFLYVLVPDMCLKSF